jgi:hypothetical protein
VGERGVGGVVGEECWVSRRRAGREECAGGVSGEGMQTLSNPSRFTVLLVCSITYCNY